MPALIRRTTTGRKNMSRCSEVYPELDAYLLSKAGVERDYKAEWDWTRYMIRGKLFCAVCADGTDFALINVKCEPEFNFSVRDMFEDIGAGYYCNKEHWNSVKLTGTVPYETVRGMCDRGYTLILNSLTKKLRAEIAAEAETNK